MMPKIIHYCWFGRKPLPELAIKCKQTWEEYFPNYKIKEWNEDNFDVFCTQYTKEAYEAKKYAFVSDYARFWILYRYGGLYFDTDVEVIRNMDDIVDKGPFMGCERDISDETTTLAVAPGLGLGVNPGLGLYKEILDMYETLSFYNPDGTYNQKTVVAYTTEILCKHGLKAMRGTQECAGVWIYPKDYFCPLDYVSKQLVITDNTRTIHHYSASWITRSQRLYIRLKKCIGESYAAKTAQFLKRIKLFK